MAAHQQFFANHTECSASLDLIEESKDWTKKNFRQFAQNLVEYLPFSLIMLSSGFASELASELFLMTGFSSISLFFLQIVPAW